MGKKERKRENSCLVNLEGAHAQKGRRGIGDSVEVADYQVGLPKAEGTIDSSRRRLGRVASQKIRGPKNHWRITATSKLLLPKEEGTIPATRYVFFPTKD